MKRILFVDDEMRVLEGLQRMLHGMRKEWDMHFVDNGEAALELLERSERPFDVLVTDVRMPGMDGAELLGRVQSAFPGIVRIILSGHAELELAMRSTTCAHQFLNKPCNAEVIKTVVTRSFALHQSLADERVKDMVGQLTVLPSVPKTYADLCEAMKDEEVTIQEVSDIVARDPSIAAKILQLVNSSFFGSPRALTSLRDSVSFLGLANLRTLVLQYGLTQEFDAESAAPSFSMDAHLTHSLNVANLARRMHPNDRRLSELSFLAGILHDVGRLVLATNMPDVFERVERLRRTGRVHAHVLETRALGVSHCEMGAYLLGIWGMPDPIVEAAHSHHDPSALVAAPRFDEVASVHVATALLDLLEEPTLPDGLNMDLVRALGREEDVPKWRELAVEVHDRDDTQAAA